MLSRSEPQKEIEIATSEITTMFLNFGKFEPQRFYKHGSYRKTRPIAISRVLQAIGFRPTNQLTHQPTNKAAYRVACKRLKSL